MSNKLPEGMGRRLRNFGNPAFAQYALSRLEIMINEACLVGPEMKRRVFGLGSIPPEYLYDASTLEYFMAQIMLGISGRR